jgi:general nucleoside transport system ATP-binding protein
MQPFAGTVPQPLLRLSGITKQFPGCLANDNVDLSIGYNEIHALLGENGAGKSTLVKILYGLIKPDRGEIRIQGEPATIRNPAHARHLGISMVFQHFSLFEALTVTENICLSLDREERKGLRGRIGEISESYGLTLNPDAAVHDLSAGERQRVEIVRSLLQRPKLLIMDEPTSVLTPQEAEKLFSVLRQLASEGCSILYISHKLKEVRELCSRATIMRLGRVVAECDTKQKTPKELAELMINTELKTKPRKWAGSSRAPPRLVLDELSLGSSHQFGTGLKDVCFTVRGGEILGIAGISGNGQNELMDALSGEVAAGKPEAVLLDSVPIGRMGPRARRRLGACFLPEEREGHGAVPGMTLAENVFLSASVRAALTRLGVIHGSRTVSLANRIIKRFDVRTTGPKAETRSLSGGNLQKFLVGREVQQQPGVLIINQPTWGVDAGAAAAIHEAIIQLAAGGTAVVLISQDLDEIMQLCDRIAVIAAGRLSPPVPALDLTVAQIGFLMGGTTLPAQRLTGQELVEG